MEKKKKLTNYVNNNKNAIIRAKRPIASVNAKPKITIPNKSALTLGFREKPTQ